MIYTAIDTFYLTDEELSNSPSRKDGVDESTETSLRIYGCDLIQESGILLKLPQAVMATGQVLFHRLFCKKSFARFNAKGVAASCVWLASKLEESPRKARQVLVVFHRMECRRENLPIEHLDPFSKSEVVACGVVYAAARKFQVPLPENPPWWKAFDADKAGIDEVCRVLAHLYSLPKARYIPLRRDGDAFTLSSKPWNAQSQPVPKEGASSLSDTTTPKSGVVAVDPVSSAPKDSTEAVLNEKNDGDSKSMHVEVSVKEDPVPKSRSQRSVGGGDWNKQRERDRERDKDRSKSRDHDRIRDSDREHVREETERDPDKVNDRGYRSKDRAKDSGGHSEKSRHHSSRDRDYHTSYISRDKEWRRHYS